MIGTAVQQGEGGFDKYPGLGIARRCARTKVLKAIDAKVNMLVLKVILGFEPRLPEIVIKIRSLNPWTIRPNNYLFNFR